MSQSIEILRVSRQKSADRISQIRVYRDQSSPIHHKDWTDKLDFENEYYDLVTDMIQKAERKQNRKPIFARLIRQ